MIKTDQPTIFDTQKLVAAISSKQDGNMKFSGYESAEKTLQNRRQFLQSVGINISQTAYMFVGSPHAWDVIHEVQPAELGVGITDQKKAIIADALITNQPGYALFLPVADCNPVIMHDPTTQSLALVHLGWQSTAADLAYKVVAFLRQTYRVNPANLRVHFGPAIKPQSYTFKDDLDQANDPAWIPFLLKIGESVGVDLPGFNRKRLLDAGVLPQHIAISPVDTAVSDDYFSNYRANRAGLAYEGRFAASCMLLL